MKKYLTIILAIVLSLSLAACGGLGGGSDGGSGSIATDTPAGSPGSQENPWPADSGLYPDDTVAGVLGTSAPVSDPSEAASAEVFFCDQEGDDMTGYLKYVGVYFTIADKDGTGIIVPMKIDVSIVNRDGEEVYSGTFSITQDNYYENGAAGGYSGHVLIPSDDFEFTHISSGVCNVRFYSEGVFDYEHSSPTNEIPCLPATLLSPDLPLEVSDPTYMAGKGGTIRITNIHASLYELNGSCCDVYIDGQLLDYDGSLTGGSPFDVVCNLTDEEGNLIDYFSGPTHLDIFPEDDGSFKDVQLAKYTQLDHEKTYQITIEPISEED